MGSGSYGTDVVVPPPKEMDGSEKALAKAGQTAVIRANSTSKPSKGSHVFHDSGLFKGSSPAGVSHSSMLFLRKGSGRQKFVYV